MKKAQLEFLNYVVSTLKAESKFFSSIYKFIYYFRKTLIFRNKVEKGCRKLVFFDIEHIPAD
jgi:hypothetical protein